MTFKRAAMVLAALMGGLLGVLVEGIRPAPVAHAATPKEALLIGDSVMNGLAQNYSNEARALLGRRHTYILDSAGCRRLLATSCSIRGNPRPTTAITELHAHAGDFNRALVVAVGYNDDTNGPVGLGAAVDAFMATARSQGVPWVIWLTYRENVTSSTFRPRFQAHNQLLRQKLKQYPNLRLADWAGRSRSFPTTWFSKDGIHLGGQAALEMADLIADTIDALPPANRCAAGAWVGQTPASTPSVTASARGGVHLLASPVRIADTRFGYGALGSGREMIVPVAGRYGIPSTAFGAAVTVTAERPCLATRVSVYACGGAPPAAPSFLLAAPAKLSVSGSTMVRLGSGRLCVWASGATEVKVDVTAWIGPGGAKAVPVASARVVDTRVGRAELTLVPHKRLAAGQRLTVDLRHTVAAIGTGSGVSGVTLGLRFVRPSVHGAVSVLPGSCTTATPPVVTAFTIAGHDSTASATVRLTTGKVCVITASPLDLVVDLQTVYRSSGKEVVVRGAPAVRASSPSSVKAGAAWSVSMPYPGTVKALLVGIAALHPATTTSITVAACSATSRPDPQLIVVAGRSAATLAIVPYDGGPVCVTVTGSVPVVLNVQGVIA
jgi:hypothetical protein